MRIALTVGVGVMHPVLGHPLDHRTLDCRRPQRCKRAAYRSGRSEASMGEQTMKPDRDADAGQKIRDREHHQVLPSQQAAPRLP